MKFFLDTEFIESGPGKPIQLVSIGIVSFAGAEFYAVSSEFDPETASDWVKENVFPQIGSVQRRLTLKEIGVAIKEFVRIFGDEEKPEFWGYYADYDWVVFCQTFGAMVDLPEGFPMYCRDIKQWCDELGNPKLPKQVGYEHNALNDAKWNRHAWQFLKWYSMPAS